MSISLICSCGARLEIDAKFAGQTIACPDCQKPLTAAPPPPPPQRTSGLALTSLLLALVGAFTVVGTMAAAIVGAVAFRRIARQPGVGGRQFAKAGIVLGGILTLVALAAYSSSISLGLDGLLRQYRWAGKLQFATELAISKQVGAVSYSLQRPSARWGMFELPPSAADGEHALLVEPREDAQVLWLSGTIHPEDDAFSLRARALEIFKGATLLKIIGKPPELPVETFRERDVTENGKEQKFFFDAPIGGIERTFLFRLLPKGERLHVLIGGARKQRFARVADDLGQAVDAFKEVSR